MISKFNIILICIYFISMVAAFTYHFIKINKLKKTILNSKTSNILKEILNLSIKGEEIDKAAEKIVIVIRKYFELSYCSIYIRNDNELNLIATNVEENNRTLLREYINKLSISLKYEGQIRNSKTVLSYPTAENRKIKYSYFIPLVCNSEVIGAIHIENKTIKNMDKIQREFFRIIVENISVVFQNMIYSKIMK